VVVPYHLRFLAGSTASGVTCTGYELGAACGVMAATSTTAYSICQSVKVNKVEMWSPPASQGAASTCSVLWTSAGGTVFTSNMEISDTTVSTAFPAHVESRPPVRSLAADWIQVLSTSENVFSITCPSGTIIDVYLTAILADASSAPTAVTVAGATVGVLYYQPLDGDGGVLNPIGKTVGP
jgi:hypothetical protein